jgi:hypothetical protein
MHLSRLSLVAMHAHPAPAGASGHHWPGSPEAEEPNLAIVRYVGRRRQAHSAANIPPTCLMSRRVSARLWVDLSVCSLTPAGLPDRHSNSVGAEAVLTLARSARRRPRRRRRTLFASPRRSRSRSQVSVPASTYLSTGPAETGPSLLRRVIMGMGSMWPLCRHYVGFTPLD